MVEETPEDRQVTASTSAKRLEPICRWCGARPGVGNTLQGAGERKLRRSQESRMSGPAEMGSVLGGSTVQGGSGLRLYFCRC